MTIRFEEGFFEKIKATGNNKVNLHFISCTYYDTDSFIVEKGEKSNILNMLDVKVSEIKDKIQEIMKHHFEYILNDNVEYRASMIQDGKDVYFVLMRV